MGIVGLRGVGKSSALQTTYGSRLEQEDRDIEAKGSAPQCMYGVVLFKWRRQPELFRSLLNGSHSNEASESFLNEYQLCESGHQSNAEYIRSGR